MSHTTPDPLPPASPWSPFEAAYRGCVSLDRLRAYDKSRDDSAWVPMIGRYLYNVALAGALYGVLHWAEITLRNRLTAVIGTAYPVGGGRRFRRVPSWLDADPPVLLPNERTRVDQALAHLARKHPRGSGRRGAPLTEGRLVAELSFGFWTHLLDGSYENWRIGQRLWPALLEPVFPHCPPAARHRRHVHARFQEIKEIRNRTFHHERISHLVTLPLYDRFLEAVWWMDPVIAAGVLHNERQAFARLMADGPAPFVAWAGERARGGPSG